MITIFSQKKRKEKKEKKRKEKKRKNTIIDHHPLRRTAHRSALFLVDAVCLAENREQHRHIFSRCRTRRRCGNRAQRLIVAGDRQASGSAAGNRAGLFGTWFLLQSSTPGSITLVAGPREDLVPYTFVVAGQTSTSPDPTPPWQTWRY
jgi:hypothetical protein